MMLTKLVEKGYLNPRPKKLRINYQSKDAYSLTAKGRDHFKWDERTCLGDRTATGIVEYTEPSDMAGMTFTKVKFTYDVALNEFSRDLGLEEMIRNDMHIDGKGNAVFVKTNKGWRLEKGW